MILFAHHTVPHTTSMTMPLVITIVIGIAALAAYAIRRDNES